WFFPPTNLSGSFAAGTNNVNLSWDAPNTSNSSTNWYEYAATADCGSFSSSAYTTRVVYFKSDELAYIYPIKITQLRIGFYDNGAWTNTQFKFVIYAEDLTTKLYETAVLNANQNGNVSTYSYTLPEAVTVSGNFYVGVETVASDGSPFNLLKQQADNNYHTYVYDGTNWYYYSDGTNAYDLPQGVYIDGGKGGKWLNSSVNLSSVNLKPINTGIARIINNQPKSMLTGYRVYKDGTQIGSDLPVNTTAYTDNSVCGTHNYSVTALYSGYNGESDAVQTSLTYNSPAITSQPSSATVCDGDNVTFSVTASGDDLSYQWQKDGGNISGANSDTYTITGVLSGDAGNYTCDISNVCGSVSSDAATLTVNPAPVAPTSVTATLLNQCAGIANQLSYTGGSGDTFKWYTGSCGATEIGTGNNLSISPTFTTTYYGRWEKTCGVSSCESVTVTVTDATAITTQPQSQAACENDNVTFTVTATGSNLTYQWQKDGSDISGATFDTYTVSNVSASDAGNYTCEVNGDCGTVSSDAATLTISAATSITTQPASVNANAGDNITFSVVAEGSNLSYQWQFNSADITGETADLYTINNVQVSDAGNYDVVVSGDCGNVTSDIAVLTVASSVEDLAAFGINIYPNPSDGTFRIEIKNKEKTADVSISDMTGKLIYSNKLNTSEDHIIKLNYVSKGVYFIKINLGDKSVVSKLIIQ
ncbi:MAG: immunoglobulin domain-containing protein, partial [Bacteroidales bacterium]|nr:immunoglobulin domain-containing protein [Bacteroidales bacterium]